MALCSSSSPSEGPQSPTSPSLPLASSPSARSAAAFHPARRLATFSSPTVWHEFTPLAAASKAINLGQGFPGWSPPSFVREAAERALREEGEGVDFMVNQYSRSAGHLPLVKALSSFYTRALGRPIDPLTEVLVTVGASEALCASLLGLLDEGDEVVALQPAFDMYIAQAEMCGAVLRPVSLEIEEKEEGKKHWVLDFAKLEAAFSPKTRLFILNTPHNPTGKVFTREELLRVEALLKKFPQVVVLADEVYEHLAFELPHVSFASLSSFAFERTLTVSSSAKTFSVTGWKVGWLVGPPHLIRSAATAHQWISFCVATPLQEAVAHALRQAEEPFEGFPSYYAWLNSFYKQKRERLAKALQQAGIEPILPEGSFFIVGDTSGLVLPSSYSEDKAVTRDWAVCRWLTKEIGVAAIPPSAFYSQETKEEAKNLARFAFCKPDDLLDEAAKRLLKCANFLKKI